MLVNPFTPSSVVSAHEEFVGRQAELDTLSRSLGQGSVVLHGGVGIGKSSLLARLLNDIDNIVPDSRCDWVAAVGNADVTTVDDAARLVLEELTTVDQKQKTVGIDLRYLKFESGTTYSYFSEGRHLATLNRLLDDRSFGTVLKSIDYLVIAIDEADKCPEALAGLVRGVSTRAQLKGIANLRFIIAGVSPFFDKMLAVDEGLVRMFSQRIQLGQLTEEEGRDLLEAKLTEVCASAEESGIPLKIDPGTIDLVLELSGCHPHLIQLLGSSLVEHECEEADGVLDKRDLAGALRTICYDVRGAVYERLRHTLEIEGKMDAFILLLDKAEPGYPARIASEVAQKYLSTDDLEWLRSRDFIVQRDGEYRLTDDLFRIRLLLDEEAREASRAYSDALDYAVRVDPSLLSDVQDSTLYWEWSEPKGISFPDS